MSRKLLRAMPWSIGLAVLAFGVQPVVRGAQDTGPAARTVPATPEFPPLVELTSEQDRQRVMDQLKITSFPATPMALAGVGADPVYKLLGKKDLGTTEYPARETALMTGDIGFRQHSAGHTPNPNWVYFLDFAAKYWDAKPAAK